MRASKSPCPIYRFELLLALIRVAPNFLSNDSLMARVWPGQIVTPETVAKRVNLLRVALGDSAQAPRYIAGVRGRGYRLVAAVSPAIRPAPPWSSRNLTSCRHGTRWQLSRNSRHEAEPDVVVRVTRPIGSHCRDRYWHACGE